MKRLIFGIAVAVLLALGSASVAIVNAGEQSHSNQILVCHFPGHTNPGGVGPPRDFVAGMQTSSACSGLSDSRAIWVSPSACKNGHRALPSPNGRFDCDGLI